MLAQLANQTAQANAFLVWRIQALRQREAQARVFRGVIFRRHDAAQ